MKQIFIKGALLSAALVSGAAMATELETESQKLGYIIGMDIGASLKQQGTDIDIDTLLEAVRATYNGEPLAMTPEEAASVRETFIATRRAEAESHGTLSTPPDSPETMFEDVFKQMPPHLQRQLEEFRSLERED